MIKINNVHKSFNGVEVLKDITLEIKKGEVFGLVGHSGAGKSTLLRCINGLESYDKGSILVNEYEEVKALSNKTCDFFLYLICLQRLQVKIQTKLKQLKSLIQNRSETQI